MIAKYLLPISFLVEIKLFISPITNLHSFSVILYKEKLSNELRKRFLWYYYNVIIGINKRNNG